MDQCVNRTTLAAEKYRPGLVPVVVCVEHSRAAAHATEATENYIPSLLVRDFIAQGRFIAQWRLPPFSGSHLSDCARAADGVSPPSQSGGCRSGPSPPTRGAGPGIGSERGAVASGSSFALRPPAGANRFGSGKIVPATAARAAEVEARRGGFGGRGGCSRQNRRFVTLSAVSGVEGHRPGSRIGGLSAPRPRPGRPFVGFRPVPGEG